MKQLVWDVWRLCQGIMEPRFTGTEQQCRDWISHRGDTGRASYTIENPHYIEV